MAPIERRRKLVMSSRLHKRWFRVDETDGILRVALVPHEVADAESDAVADQLFALVARLRPSRLIVNLAGVRKLSSTMIGKLVALHQQLKGTGGRMVVCEVGPELGGVFTNLHLGQVLTLCGTEQDAVASFASEER